MYCKNELQVTEILHQSISPEERIIKPELSSVPITTEVLTVETDPDVPAECPTSDSEASIDEDLELVCSEGDQTITSALSMEHITTKVIAVETDPDAPTAGPSMSKSRRAFRVVCCGWLYKAGFTRY